MSKKYDYTIDPGTIAAPAKIVELVGRDKKVLEIGCSVGSQTRVLSGQSGCRVTGIELDPAAAKEATQFCDRVIVGDVEQLLLDEMLNGERFDVIMFADVLEHLRDPSRVLAKVRGLLAEDGYVVASIPNIVHSSVVMEMLHGRFDYREYGLLDNTHIRFFTRKSVYRLFEDAGFTISKLDRVIGVDVNTEFQGVQLSAPDRFVSDYLRSHNPESDTFQFIIQAVKAANVGAPTSYALLDAQERLRDLEERIADRDAKVRKLQSELDWLTNRPWHRLFGRLLSRGARRPARRDVHSPDGPTPPN